MPKGDNIRQISQNNCSESQVWPDIFPIWLKGIRFGSKFHELHFPSNSTDYCTTFVFITQWIENLQELFEREKKKKWWSEVVVNFKRNGKRGALFPWLAAKATDPGGHPVDITNRVSTLNYSQKPDIHMHQLSLHPAPHSFTILLFSTLSHLQFSLYSLGVWT